MEDHERISQDAEADLEELRRQSGELGEDIDEARRDWEDKKADSSVPGADEQLGDDAA